MEDRRFQRLLRSALALSLTTPAVGLAACNGQLVAPSRDDASVDGSAPEGATPQNEVPSTPMDASAVADAAGDGSATACVLDPGPKPSVDCNVVTNAVPPPAQWAGGYYQGYYFPPGDYSNYDPDAASAPVLHVCGCADLSKTTFTTNQCSVLRQFPCGVFPYPTSAFQPDLLQSPVPPSLLHGDLQTLEACKPYCPSANCMGARLSACRGIDEAPGNPGSLTTTGSPILECLYEPADPATACGCADLPAAQIGCFQAQWPTQLPCSLLDAAVDEQGDLPPPQTGCKISHDDSGVPYVTCADDIDDRCPGPGRRPSHLMRVRAARGNAIGAWLADASHLEAASVPAFAILQEELRVHHAPIDLINRAKQAEVDEVKHTRMMAELARRFGAEEGGWADSPQVHPSPTRSLEEIAIENAVEGCVNETYGALLAMWQSENAREETIRDAMRVIAEDETRHAALAWSVHEWLLPKLDSHVANRVANAISDAFAKLLRQSTASELVAARLLPSQSEVAGLVSGLHHSLFC